MTTLYQSMYTANMKTVFWLLTLIILLVGAFFAFNQYIYNEKQGEMARLPDGEYVGFIRALTDNATAMDFDEAQWLAGEEGEKAAIAADICTEETRAECLPNDFFIANPDQTAIRLAVAVDASVIMQTWLMEETGTVEDREISRPAFAELINDPSAHWRELPYRITVENGITTIIQEVYIP